MKTLIFGHKNPDTDSVCSAIAYSFLKNSLNEETEPRVLGEIKNEARYKNLIIFICLILKFWIM